MDNRIVENIYLDGDSNGIMISNLRMSPITTYVIPRSLLSKARKIEGINNPGVYFLVGEENENNIPEMYIGETSKGINRIFDHDKKKDFWGKVILFLADVKHFDQSFINQLEEYLIEHAYKANRYKLYNGNIPQANKRTFDASYIEMVYDQIKFLMSSYGYPLENISALKKNNKVFKTTRRGIEALGSYLGDKFEVLEGSQIDMSRACDLEKYNQMRTELLNSGDIEKIGDKYILKKTVSFKTPSSAGVFALGGSINGWAEWKDKNGKTLDELYRK